MRLLKKGKG